MPTWPSFLPLLTSPIGWETPVQKRDAGGPRNLDDIDDAASRCGGSDFLGLTGDNPEDGRDVVDAGADRSQPVRTDEEPGASATSPGIAAASLLPALFNQRGKAVPVRSQEICSDQRRPIEIEQDEGEQQLEGVFEIVSVLGTFADIHPGRECSSLKVLNPAPEPHARITRRPQHHHEHGFHLAVAEVDFLHPATIAGLRSRRHQPLTVRREE